MQYMKPTIHLGDFDVHMTEEISNLDYPLSIAGFHRRYL